MSALSQVRLWDSQWVNVVNHDHAYQGWCMDEAIAHAVRMTEQLIAKNVADAKLPPLRITEDAVTRACEAFGAYARKTYNQHEPDPPRACVRAALEAMQP